MSEPDITQDEQDVEGHTWVKRDAPQNESDARDALDTQDDDDVAGHTSSRIK